MQYKEIENKPVYNVYIDYRMAFLYTASYISTRLLNISWRTVRIVIQNSCLSACNINFYVLIMRLTYLQSGGLNAIIKLLLKPKQQTKGASVQRSFHILSCSYDLDESEQQHITCYFMILEIAFIIITLHNVPFIS